MTYQSLQTLSQIVVAVGLILSALGGYGAYHYGKKVDEEKANKEKSQNLVNIENDSLPVVKKETNINVQKNNGLIIGEQSNNFSTSHVVPKQRPTIDLCHRGITVEQVNDTTAFFDIPYCAGKNANAYNVKLQTAIILKINNELILTAPFNEKFPENISLSYETGKSISYKLFPYTKEMIEKTYIYVKGGFTNDDESKEYEVSDIYKYSSHSRIWLRTVGDEDLKVRSYLKEQNIL